MSFVNSLEQKLGHLAIPHLVRILAGFQVAVWVLVQLRPEFADFIALRRADVLHGEVWRLITWVFAPGRTNAIWLFIAVMAMFMMGDALEEAWGTFRVNLYVLGGITAVNIGAVVFGYAPFGLSIYSMIFLAFAVFFPDYEFYVFFILPVKVKYLAWLTGALLILTFASSSASRLPILFATVNFIVAFGPHFFRRMTKQASVVQRRARFQNEQRPEGTFFHKCASCGKTDVDHPTLEFRVTDDGEEYCNVCRPKKVPEKI